MSKVQDGTYQMGMLAMAMFALTLFACGCSKQPATEPAAGGDIHAGHDHTAEHEGPHHGHVIELGHDHAYHAELVENEAARTVDVYLLDKDLKEMPIGQTSVVMNLKVDGTAKTFDLAAVDAVAGMASRFAMGDASLFEALHEHQATGKLRVMIEGTPHSGDVEHHHHAHEGHGHEDKHAH